MAFAVFRKLRATSYGTTSALKLPGVELSVGTALPDTVELHEVPNIKYRYVVVDNRTVGVDSGYAEDHRSLRMSSFKACRSGRSGRPSPQPNFCTN
jgi:uncharacterized protein DUF1236